MGRGVRVACEACAYQFDLYEYADRLAAPAEAAGAAASGWRGYLCPECVAPAWIAAAPGPAAYPSALAALLTPAAAEDDPMVALLSEALGQQGAWERVAPRAADTPAETPPPPAPHCATCGATLLSYAAATRELAAASRTRVGLDLRAETAGRSAAAALLARVSDLRAAVAAGERHTTDALAALHTELAIWLARAAADPRDARAPLAATTALAQLDEALAAAPDLATCDTLLAQRIEQARRHIAALEQCVEDEAALPGVPCPACQTGHLLHWPIWG
ncbi:MAG TPA: hypothetical protein VID73_11505 [Ktedonobacterales bacterium]|jgi:hypothetical protein